MILFTDQSSNLSKQYFQILRPCHDEEIYGLIRIVKEGCGGLYGFFSAHSQFICYCWFFYFSLPITKMEKISFFMGSNNSI